MAAPISGTLNIKNTDDFKSVISSSLAPNGSYIVNIFLMI
jgi:hypothetical protein